MDLYKSFLIIMLIGMFGSPPVFANPLISDPLISDPLISETESSSEQSLAAFLLKYKTQMTRLDIPNMALSYKENLVNLGSKADLIDQRETLSELLSELSIINAKNLTYCSLIDLELAQNDIKVSFQRAQLGIEYTTSAAEINDQGLYGLAEGARWYEYYLQAWLGDELDPDDLFLFGENELKLAVASYRSIQAELGFKGDDQGLQSFLLNAQVHHSTDLEEIQSIYEEKQLIVRQHLASQFKSEYDVPLVKIVRSDRGMDFPAPGWYGRDGEFFYNMFTDSYDLRQTDWLFIHEATPGHHFQLTINRNQIKCPRESPATNSAFNEGWAAYAETLGTEMGLYQSAAEKLGGIEWNMIRSARVALDVGINYYGWTDKEALAYWHKNVIGKKDVAMREINRMRNWPVQVITYKYGANAFSEMKSYYIQHAKPDADVREYHDLALSYGSMLVSTFKTLVVRSIESN